MPTNKKRGPNSIEDQLDELARKNDAVRRERRDVADYNDEERAIASAEYHGEDAPEQTASGRRITRHEKSSKGRRKKLRSSFDVSGVIGTANAITESLALLATAGLLSKNQKAGMADTFDRQSNQQRIGLQPPHEDVHYIYDTMNVSKPVHDKLMRESEIIAKKIEELAAVKEPAQRQQMAANIEKMATEFEMRMHPITGVYVHDYNRVLCEEEACRIDNAAPNMDMEFNVCVFLAKAELSDLRGIKAKIGDQYNQDPREAIAAGDHLKGTAPAPVLT